MPKYWGGKLFRTWEILRSGSKAKNGERKREREKERLNDGDNNGQATHGARKHAWRTQATWAKKIKIGSYTCTEKSKGCIASKRKWICSGNCEFLEAEPLNW